MTKFSGGQVVLSTQLSTYPVSSICLMVLKVTIKTYFLNVILIKI